MTPPREKEQGSNASTRGWSDSLLRSEKTKFFDSAAWMSSFSTAFFSDLCALLMSTLAGRGCWYTFLRWARAGAFLSFFLSFLLFPEDSPFLLVCSLPLSLSFSFSFFFFSLLPSLPFLDDDDDEDDVVVAGADAARDFDLVAAAFFSFSSMYSCLASSRLFLFAIIPTIVLVSGSLSTRDFLTFSSVCFHCAISDLKPRFGSWNCSDVSSSLSLPMMTMTMIATELLVYSN